MADGNIAGDGGTTTIWKLGLVLAEKDYDHLADFCRFIGVGPPTRNQSSLVKGKRYGIARKSIRNDHLCEALMKHGVVPAKTLNAKTSCVCGASAEFWRGVFDGDGSVSVDKRTGALTLELAGSEDLMKQFCEFCRPLYPNKKTHPDGKLYTPRQIGTKHVYRVRMGGPLSQEALAALYDAPGPRLARKEAKFRAWQESGWQSRRGEYQS